MAECSTKNSIDEDNKEQISISELQLEILLWNVSGIKEKEKNSTKLKNYFRKFNVIVLTETLLVKNEFDNFRGTYDDHGWILSSAEKGTEKNIGGISIGIMKKQFLKFKMRALKGYVSSEKEILPVEIVFNEMKQKLQTKLIIICVLNLKSENFFKELNETIKKIENEKTPDDYLLSVGNFKARTSELGGFLNNNTGRKSKDSKWDYNGTMLLGVLNETGWGIMNGNTTGDEDGKYTYLGHKGYSVIDYVITNRRTKKAIEKIQVIENNNILITKKNEVIPIDHRPLEITMKMKLRVIVSL